MKNLSLTQAARKAGKPKSAILRAIQDGRLAASRAANGQYEIDPAKLLSAFPPEGESEPEPAAAPTVAAKQPEAAPTEPVVASDVAIAKRPAKPVEAKKPEAAPTEPVVVSDVAIAERPATPVESKQPEAAPAEAVAAPDVAIAEQVATPVEAEQPEAAPTQPLVAPEVAKAEAPPSPVVIARETPVKQERPAQPLNVPGPPRGPFSNVMDPVAYDAKRLLRYLQGLVTPRNSK